MAVQSREDFTNHNFVASGTAEHVEDQTILQDVARTTPLAVYTLMSQVPASEFWVPFTDETAVDGTEKPTGICMHTIPAADLVAGNVTGKNIMVSGKILDENQIVIENSLGLDTVIASIDMTVRTFMRRNFQFVQGVVTSRAENA